MTEIALTVFIALSVGGLLIGLLHPWLTGEAPGRQACPGPFRPEQQPARKGPRSRRPSHGRIQGQPPQADPGIAETARGKSEEAAAEAGASHLADAVRP